MHNACLSFGSAGLKGCKLICQQLRLLSEGYERRWTSTMAKFLRRYGKNRNFVGKNVLIIRRWMQMVVHQLVSNDLLVQDVALKLNERFKSEL